MNQTILLEQNHKATGLKIFLASMQDSHIKHLIKLAQEPTLASSMGWDTNFADNDIEGFMASIANFALPYSRKSSPILSQPCSF